MPGFHHYGRVVSDIDRSMAFYRDLLGLRVVVDEDLSGPELDAQVELEGAAMRTAMLSFAEGAMIELIEYRQPAAVARTDGRTQNRLGNDHPCVAVDDIHADYERLRAAGVRFSCPPQYIDGGHFEGDWVTFCFDPDDLTVELWQRANHG